MNFGDFFTPAPPRLSCDLLLLTGRHAPYPNLYPDQSPSEEWTMEERFRPLTFHGLILRSQLVNLLIRGVCYAESESVSGAHGRRSGRSLHARERVTVHLLQSATQPRLSYGEMTEDYPRYPDIHDLDLTLLNPRMIVVRAARPPAPREPT